MMETTLTPYLGYLRHFQAIARHRNLRRAAEALHLSPSAVTQALKQLEEGLGVTLCLRSRKEFQLTPEGQRLWETTNAAFRELEKFTETARQQKKTGGHLCLGVIDGFSNPRYEQALEETLRQFPAVRVSIMVFPSEEIIRRLQTGEIDGGFGIFNERKSNLTYKKIGEERLTYFISDRHELFHKKVITKELVRGQKSVWIDNASKNKIELEREVFRDRPHQSLKICAFTNNEGVAIQLLKTGRYIVPLPDTFTASPRAKGCREIKISKGPRVLHQEFVSNPKLTGNAVLQLLTEML